MSEISHSEVARRTFFSGGIAAAASIGGIPSALGAAAGGSGNTYLGVACKTLRCSGVGIISQNGNAQEEGLGASFWKPVRAAWKDPSDANRALLRSRIGFEGIKSLYLTGVRDSLSIPPENYWLDSALAARPGITDIQVDLKIDYETNIQLYPKFQEFFRRSRVPILAIWGETDPAFIPAGAHAFLRDSPHAVVRLLDTGHFALVTHLDPP